MNAIEVEIGIDSDFENIPRENSVNETATNRSCGFNCGWFFASFFNS